MEVRNWVIENLARVGYERMFEGKWKSLHPNGIERALWREIAASMLTELQRLWEENKDRG